MEEKGREVNKITLRVLSKRFFATFAVNPVLSFFTPIRRPGVKFPQIYRVWSILSTSACYSKYSGTHKIDYKPLHLLRKIQAVACKANEF